MTDERSREHLIILAKGLSVLTSFSRENPSMTLSEVAKRTGLNPSVVLQKRRNIPPATELLRAEFTA